MNASKSTIRIEYLGLATEELIRQLRQGRPDSRTEEALTELILERGVPENEWDALLAKADLEQGGIPGLAALDARLIANMFDGLLVALLLLAPTLAGSNIPLVNLSLGLGGIGYFFLMDGMRNGQSVGKRIVGISVIDRDSRLPIGKGSSFLRNMTLILGPLDWVFAFGKNRQRLGDIFANTIVIEVPSGDQESKH